MPNSSVYRMSVPTTGILGNGGGCHPVIIPGGALLHVKGNFADGGFMECMWDGKQVTVLALDIQERGTLMESS
jgi:hypothetical protein